MKQELTQDYLKECLTYDKDTGVFTRKIKSSTANIGDIAGHPHKRGYLLLSIGNKKYIAHRLAWFYEYGVWPVCQIDHIDTIKHHNWISNLRVLSKSQNNTGCINRNVIQKTPEQIHEICRLLQDTNLSDEVIANTLGYCTRATVRDIKTRYTQKDIGNNYNWDHRGWLRSEAIEKQSIRLN